MKDNKMKNKKSIPKDVSTQKPLDTSKNDSKYISFKQQVMLSIITVLLTASATAGVTMCQLNKSHNLWKIQEALQNKKLLLKEKIKKRDELSQLISETQSYQSGAVDYTKEIRLTLRLVTEKSSRIDNEYLYKVVNNYRERVEKYHLNLYRIKELCKFLPQLYEKETVRNSVVDTLKKIKRYMTEKKAYVISPPPPSLINEAFITKKETDIKKLDDFLNFYESSCMKEQTIAQIFGPVIKEMTLEIQADSKSK